MNTKLRYFLVATGVGIVIGLLTRSAFAGSVAAFLLAAILFGAAGRTFPPRP